MRRHRQEWPPATPGAWAALIPPAAFSARLAVHRAELVTDDDYAALSKDARKGRPSRPPSLGVRTMRLQYPDAGADAAAAARVRGALRWKHALGLPLADAGVDAPGRGHCRRQLLEHGRERARFDRLVTAARPAGLSAKEAAHVSDSSPVLGAAGVRDPYARIRSGIRPLLRAVGDAASIRGRLPDHRGWDLGARPRGDAAGGAGGPAAPGAAAGIAGPAATTSHNRAQERRTATTPRPAPGPLSGAGQDPVAGGDDGGDGQHPAAAGAGGW